MSIITALTSTFTPPASCFSDIFYDGSTTAILAGLYLSAACFPASFLDVPGYRYYAPGVCPAGYTTACGAALTADPSNSWFQCCPIGYNCQDASYCTSILKKKTVITQAYGTETKKVGAGTEVSALPVGVAPEVPVTSGGTDAGNGDPATIFPLTGGTPTPTPKHTKKPGHY